MFTEKPQFPVRLQESSRFYPITSSQALEELCNIPLNLWEYCFRYAPMVLRQADMLKQIQEKLKNLKSDNFLVE
jgi:hypothetical protein